MQQLHMVHFGSRLMTHLHMPSWPAAFNTMANNRSTRQRDFLIGINQTVPVAILLMTAHLSHRIWRAGSGRRLALPLPSGTGLSPRQGW